MGHLTRKTTRRDFPLNLGQSLELEMGPKPNGRTFFASEDELREAWDANSAQIIERYAFQLHSAGWRPLAYWYLEAGDPALVDDDFRADSPREADRLRWLRDHDAFLDGELVQMRRAAMRDPKGYAAVAVSILAEE